MLIFAPRCSATATHREGAHCKLAISINGIPSVTAQQQRISHGMLFSPTWQNYLASPPARNKMQRSPAPRRCAKAITCKQEHLCSHPACHAAPCGTFCTLRAQPPTECAAVRHSGILLPMHHARVISFAFPACAEGLGRPRASSPPFMPCAHHAHATSAS